MQQDPRVFEIQHYFIVPQRLQTNWNHHHLLAYRSQNKHRASVNSKMDLCSHSLECQPIKPEKAAISTAPQCNTTFAGYLGEHQSQIFYSRILVSDIHHDSTSLPPIEWKIGQTLPLELSDKYSDSDAEEHVIVLCTPIHFFKRSSQSPHDMRQSRAKASEDNGIRNLTNGISNAVSDNNDKIKLNLENMHVNHIPKRDSLASILIYYPVEYLSTADDLNLSSDMKKRFHLAPVSFFIISVHFFSYMSRSAHPKFGLLPLVDPPPIFVTSHSACLRVCMCVCLYACMRALSRYAHKQALTITLCEV